jgi:DNA sulfur modification protein DndD
MIFKSIRLKNFRQYKEDITFDFSLPQNGKNNISLLIAANGVGKTTLLQAFRYCFYGKSSNYLNLPKPDELVNNTLVEDLKDLDEATMFVEVSFLHEGTSYVARREKVFIKSKSILKETNEERFSLSQLVDKVGYKPFKETDANDKIRSILPEGLSQVFMFDGERMERNISDRAFSHELKESILGILDIKKYDKLIDILGYPGKSTSVIGILSNKKTANNSEDQKIKNQYEQLQSQEVSIKQEIDDINEKIEEVDQKIKLNKEQQEAISQNKERAKKRNTIDDKIKDEEIILNNLARTYIKESKHALLYKFLLLNKSKYDDFINLGRKHDHFYSYLHVNTIQDIQEKGICVCGSPVTMDSEEFKRLEELKKTALPIESAQHLNLIDQKFKQSIEFKEVMQRLGTIKSDMRTSKKNIMDWIDDSHKLTQEISRIEKQLGLQNQTEIEQLIDAKVGLATLLGDKEGKLRLCEDGIKRLQKKIDVIDKNSQYNQKINKVIGLVQDIKTKLEQIKDSKDSIARSILSEKFNDSLSKTIHGSYDVSIDSKYQVKIVDKGNNKDVTTALSTGQNVVISLSFMSALIATAKQLSAKINKDEKYGVIMDAALSNLDEVHIERLCRHAINNIDQLVFLSFKRQLRDEMYQGIKNNIGKAYVIDKLPNGQVVANDVSLSTLDDYIHSIEEE